MEHQLMIEEIRELFQTLLLPQFEGLKLELAELKGEIKLANTKIDALDSKVESYRRETAAEIRRVEDTLSANFVRIESNVDVRLVAMDQRIESLRRELPAE